MFEEYFEKKKNWSNVRISARRFQFNGPNSKFQPLDEPRSTYQMESFPAKLPVAKRRSSLSLSLSLSLLSSSLSLSLPIYIGKRHVLGSPFFLPLYLALSLSISLYLLTKWKVSLQNHRWPGDVLLTWKLRRTNI